MTLKKLTPEQEALIPVYLEKWRAIALSTEPINRQQATAAIENAYAAINQKAPEIIFCDSPLAAWKTIIRFRMIRNKLGIPLKKQLENLESLLYYSKGNKLYYTLHAQLCYELKMQIGRLLANQLYSQLYDRMETRLGSQLVNQLERENHNCIFTELWLCFCCLYDFATSVLNIAIIADNKQQIYSAFQDVAKSCGWIFPFENIAIICDRPRQIRLDNEHRLHAEGEPAIAYPDDFNLYSYHGVILPEKYEQLHPQQWHSQWLLEEKNAELRRVLIQGIGYDRIIQELQAIELDSWREYTLLKIKKIIDIDRRPIYLLKMTCPSTGFTHALRVPPDINSAREAIRWVNWGIDPEEFAVET